LIEPQVTLNEQPLAVRPYKLTRSADKHKRIGHSNVQRRASHDTADALRLSALQKPIAELSGRVNNIDLTQRINSDKSSQSNESQTWS